MYILAIHVQEIKHEKSYLNALFFFLLSYPEYHMESKNHILECVKLRNLQSLIGEQ